MSLQSPAAQSHKWLEITRMMLQANWAHPATEDANAPSVTYRVAHTQEDLDQAFKLVWDAYVRVGLESPQQGAGVRLTKYHLLPDAKVFVAVSQGGERHGKIIGTITVIPDGALGLPGEELAEDEIAWLRRQGRRPAEFVALACDEEGRKQRVILKLFRLASVYCQRKGYSTFLASLTERHIGFYRKFLGFAPLGELKPYQMGNGTPVQVHYINADESAVLLEQRAAVLERDPAWAAFWHEQAESVLRDAGNARPWDRTLARYLNSQGGGLSRQLSVHARETLRAEYRRYGWSFSC